jgi:hypothetical protein
VNTICYGCAMGYILVQPENKHVIFTDAGRMKYLEHKGPAQYNDDPRKVTVVAQSPGK